MSQGAWAKFKGWLEKNDMTVIPQCMHTDTTMPIQDVTPKLSQNATVGRITQLTGAKEPPPTKLIAERIRALRDKANLRRKGAKVQRKPRTMKKGL